MKHLVFDWMSAFVIDSPNVSEFHVDGDGPLVGLGCFWTDLHGVTMMVGSTFMNMAKL